MEVRSHPGSSAQWTKPSLAALISATEKNSIAPSKGEITQHSDSKVEAELISGFSCRLPFVTVKI